MTPPRVKHQYRSTVRWAFFMWADIPDADNKEYVYLRRLRLVQTPWFAIYVHWIYLPDVGRDPHNHPMNFWSWVVKGGYREMRYTADDLRRSSSRDRRRWSLARTTSKDFHKIVRLDRSPTVTVLLVGKRFQSWGFLTPQGFVDKSDYGVPS